MSDDSDGDWLEPKKLGNDEVAAVTIETVTLMVPEDGNGSRIFKICKDGTTVEIRIIHNINDPDPGEGFWFF